MTEFSPVWLSTEEQLRRLTEAYTEASVVQKSLGRFRLPSGTAHLQGWLMPWARVAIVYVARDVSRLPTLCSASEPRRPVCSAGTSGKSIPRSRSS
jgi:hypothetical protein